MLILSPNFSFGRMENLCLTHSWTGNLITNANFEHIWLNEGSVFVERKISGRMYGDKVHFQEVMGLQKLKDKVKPCESYIHSYKKLP